ncbi:hypothetical protein B0H14DRAFT_2593424 [Mycena olivaceomarginata]|nr:hypothetical protein B0H14DRAFT_2593424 [Mycena olivaceomarginata]
MSPSQAGITPSIPDEPTDHLRNAPKIQMWVIWQELGHDKKRWNSFQVCAHIYLLFVPVLSPWSAKLYCRDVATSGCLNWDGNWKSQRSEKLSIAYKATHRFEGQWAIDHTVKQYWDSPRTTGTVSTTPPRSSGKEAAARRARCVARPRRARPIPTLSQSTVPGINDSDDDSNSDNNEFLDASDPECALDEGNGNGGKSAKAKGKRKATTQGGKNPNQARRDQ